MQTELSGFRPSSPLIPSILGRFELVRTPLQVKSPDALPLVRPATATQAPLSIRNASLTPHQQLQAIAEFIDTTSRLSASQLQWLSFLEHWHGPLKHQDNEVRIEETIGLNMQILAEAVVGLSRQGKPLKIGHPETGKSVRIIDMGYLTEQPGYRVSISGPTPATLIIMPLNTGDQLHL